MRGKMFSRNLTLAFVLVTVLTFMCANMAQAALVTEGLVSYWSFNKASIQEGTVKDVWGENDGNIKGDVKIVEGKYGEALEFDGDEDLVWMPDTESLQIDEAGTIEMWVKIAEIQKYQGLFIKAGAWAGPGYVLRYSSQYQFQGGWEWVDFHQDGELIKGQWSHIAMATDGETAFLYQDGKLIKTHETTVTVDTEPLLLGFTVDVYWKGLIDEVRVYDRNLNENEVNQNMNAEGLGVESSIEKLPLTWGKLKSE